MPTVTMLLPGAPLGSDSGAIAFCSVFLVEGDGRRILFDSAHVGRRQQLKAALEGLGLTPADIDAQFLSHAHWDHVQNADVFDHAPVLIHRDELRYAHRPHHNDWATPPWTGAILDMLTTEEVGEGAELMPGCRVLELPGHSPGSIGLEVETDQGVVILTGDAVHSAAVALAGQSSLVFWNAEQADASVRRVAAMSTDGGATIYPGHDSPFRIRDGDADYLEHPPVTVTARPWINIVLDPQPGPRWVMPGIEEQRLEG